MVSSRRSHNRCPSISNHHQVVAQTWNSSLTANSNSNNNDVRSWLSQVHEANSHDATRASGSGDEASDEANDEDKPLHYKSSWHPNNLPVGRVIRGERVESRQPMHFPDDVPILTSPATSHASSSRSHSSLEIRGAECNNSNWRRSPSCDTQLSIINRSSFEKKPRRITRPNRYETRAKERQVKEKSKPRKTLSRLQATKHRLRSSRDVVDNFTSENLSNKKLTMKPNLTAGLFFNGRSSTNTRHLTDLLFNDMSFLKVQKGAKRNRNDDTLNDGRNDASFKEVDRDEDSSLDSRGHQEKNLEIGRFSPMTKHISNPALPPITLSHQLSNRGEQTTSQEEEYNPSRGQPGRHDGKLDKPQPNKEVASPAPSCGVPQGQNEAPLGSIHPGTVSQAHTPASITPGRAEIRVNDDAAGLRKESGVQQASKGTQWDTESENLTRPSPKTTPSLHISGYKDQGVMVTPRLHQAKCGFSNTPCQGSQGAEYKDAIGNTRAAGNGTFQLYTESIPPMHPHESFWSNSGNGLYTKRYSTEILDAQSESQGRRNISNLDLNRCQVEPYQGSKAFPALNFSLKNTESIRSKPLAESVHVQSFGRSDNYKVGTPYYGALSSEEPLLFERSIDGHALNHHHHPSYTVDTKDPPSHHSPLFPISGLGRPDSSLEAVDQEILKNNSSFQFNAHNRTNETMKDFIDRIEPGVSIKRKKTQYFEDAIDYDQMYDCQMDGERYHTERDDDDLDMVAFWRPNFFR